MLTTFYAATSFFDQTTGHQTSTPSNGDLVTWDYGKPDQVKDLKFGTSAFTGIQNAINATSDGDTVRVAAGLYQLTTELDIGTSISILGPQANVDPRPSAGSTRVAGGPGEAVIDGGGTAFDAFFVEASNVTINGFDLRNTADEVIDTDGTGAFTNIQVLDNFIHNAQDPANGKGVHFEGVSGGLVANNDIYNVADAGIEIGSGSVANSPNCVVKDNEVHDLGSGGISNSAIYAFATPYSSNIDVTIQGNLVYNFQGNDAIKVGSKDGSDHALSGGVVSDNVVHNVIQDGITINASNTQVTGNEVYNSSSSNAAIYVEHSDGNVTITNNFLHNNSAARATILVGDGTTAPTGVVVSKNSIQNNTNNLLLDRDLGSGHTLDASGNWWGSGAQAVVVGNVQSTTAGVIDFTPWLNSGTNASPTTPGFTPDLSSLTVAPATVSPEFGSVGRIQEGINLASSGATITVINGTYNENVDVNKSVTIDASGAVHGKITGTTGTIVAAGPLSLGDGSAQAVDTASNLNVGGQTVTLLDSAAASLAGMTTIGSGGTLVAANGISVPSGGSLSGSGTVSGAVSIAGGASLSPGAPVGTLSTGNLSLADGAAMDVTINGTDPNTGFSNVKVSGTVNLNGAVLTGTTGPNVAAGQTFEIINNGGAGAVGGTFSSLAEGATVWLGNDFFTISYAGGTGNDVVLTAKGTPDERYVAQLYLDLLHRPVDQGGLAFWSGLLAQGDSRAQVAQEIIAAGPPFEYYRIVVNGLYETYLHREADPGGLTFFADLMNHGTSEEQVATALVSSQEFYQEQGGGTVNGFLNALYEDALNRPVDSGAEQYFSNLLATGGTRADVAAAVFGSHEYHEDVVDSLFEQYLRRPADSNGLEYFASQLDAGATDQQVTVQLVASDEYFTNIA